MSNLKRYVCQLGKVLVGLPVMAFAVLAILTFAVVAAEVICYLISDFQIVQILAGLVVLVTASFVAFIIGDEIFKKYNICQRFK